MAIQRQTASVKKLWRQFEASKDALSVVDLVKELKEEMNKTTVYRILDRMESEGKLHSFSGKDGLKWYAKCQDCSANHHIDVHPHFQCNACGKVECLSVNVHIPSIKEHKIERAQILLLGQCESCLN
ncbi:MAG: transcriptional regulator [Verrucomicrobia bacterium]|nr:transcriptional regulator [Verrucomicrobiota bacterium]|tara:strand:+ start:1349 stop:1729 length:381 start_codon:yes stop_codon:yes gene_type:complete